ncbi:MULTISPECIES: universal stress protein [unclassified Amycolatopsis]|uniref:universal stress protein n=1 Tax=unclassified Amycolatopsis TaxID=2618356 RepID=UPI002876B9E8|nr:MULTISPECIES: universal stress protein [unclassified Amycolatopsis]MDS0134752.1 universal stress protein [Amycolatopsis sp. 505]MDS0148072.1 universal stress protein [Amycolatopsis sp. CM201R]
MTEATANGRIVVGVDGSDAGTAALVWAAGQAAVSGAELDVVTVCCTMRCSMTRR